MNKNILWIIVLFALVSVSAEDFIFKQNQQIDFKIPCFHNDTYCSSSATCNLTVKYPNLTTVYNNEAMTNQGAFFNHSINITYTNKVGTYYWDMICFDVTGQGYGQGIFKITQSGRETTMSDAIMYSVLIFLNIVLLVLSLMGAIGLEGKNKYVIGSEGEAQVEVRYGKYLKVALFFVSYFLLWILMFFTQIVTETYFVIPEISNFLFTIFQIMGILIIPVLIVSGIIMAVDWIADIQIGKWKKRNLPPR